MKKNLLVSAKAFTLALACTMVMGCANNANNNSASAPAAQTSDIAYVNMDSLIDKYDMYNDLSTQLMAKQNQLEQELQTKQKSIERKAMDLENQYKKNLITPTRAQEVQQNLQVEQQRMLQWRDEKMMELNDDQAKISRMVYDSIQNYINEYNADKRYRFILSNSVGGVLLYGDKSADITEIVLKALNSRYNKSGQTSNIDSLATK
ncbi:MAG: OmpH family outer membrane protein [Bacteroidales bacterium]|nr:OmpH family outer membrane protein [Bacteroidales bacterium]MBR2886894.1 OmpH family outer membrane protein [Bacteroidales bacterium]